MRRWLLLAAAAARAVDAVDAFEQPPDNDPYDEEDDDDYLDGGERDDDPSGYDDCQGRAVYNVLENDYAAPALPGTNRSSPTFSNVAFVGNFASERGGAMADDAYTYTSISRKHCGSGSADPGANLSSDPGAHTSTDPSADHDRRWPAATAAR